jgi:hypothetical protein
MLHLPERRPCRRKRGYGQRRFSVAFELEAMRERRPCRRERGESAASELEPMRERRLCRRERGESAASELEPMRERRLCRRARKCGNPFRESSTGGRWAKEPKFCSEKGRFKNLPTSGR